MGGWAGTEVSKLAQHHSQRKEIAGWVLYFESQFSVECVTNMTVS